MRRGPGSRRTKGNVEDRMINAVACLLDWPNEAGTAIQTESGSSSRADLRRRVASVARALTESGLQRGDVVALLMSDTPDALALILATMACGGIALLLPVRAQTNDLARVLELTRPFALCIDDVLMPAGVAAVRASQHVPRVVDRAAMDEWRRADARFAPMPMDATEPAFCLATSGGVCRAPARTRAGHRPAQGSSGTALAGVHAARRPADDGTHAVVGHG